QHRLRAAISIPGKDRDHQHQQDGDTDGAQKMQRQGQALWRGAAAWQLFCFRDSGHAINHLIMVVAASRGGRRREIKLSSEPSMNIASISRNQLSVCNGENVRRDSAKPLGCGTACEVSSMRKSVCRSISEA